MDVRNLNVSSKSTMMIGTMDIQDSEIISKSLVVIGTVDIQDFNGTTQGSVVIGRMETDIVTSDLETGMTIRIREVERISIVEEEAKIRDGLIVRDYVI